MGTRSSIKSPAPPGLVQPPSGSRTPTLRKTQRQLIARAISDPTRFEIFQQIAAGQCVACSELRLHLEVTAPTVSHHLKELENAGLVEMKRAGKFVNLTFRRDIWQAYLKELSKI